MDRARKTKSRCDRDHCSWTTHSRLRPPGSSTLQFASEAAKWKSSLPRIDGLLNVYASIMAGCSPFIRAVLFNAQASLSQKSPCSLLFNRHIADQLIRNRPFPLKRFKEFCLFGLSFSVLVCLSFFFQNLLSAALRSLSKSFLRLFSHSGFFTTFTTEFFSGKFRVNRVQTPMPTGRATS